MTAQSPPKASFDREKMKQHRPKSSASVQAFRPETYAVLADSIESVPRHEAAEGCERRVWAVLQTLFEQQLRDGCGDAKCTQPTCRTYRERIHLHPLRPFTQASTSMTAIMLAESSGATRRLCVSSLSQLENAKQRKQLPDQPLDVSSFTQTLIATFGMRSQLPRTGPHVKQTMLQPPQLSSKGPHRHFVLSRLSRDTSKFLTEAILNTSDCRFQEEACEFFRRSCKRILTDPWRVCDLYDQQPDMFTRPADSPTQGDNTVPHNAHREHQLAEYILTFFRAEPLGWIVSAIERIQRHASNRGDADRYLNSKGDAGHRSEVEVSVKVYKVACLFLAYYTAHAIHPKNVRDQRRSLKLGLAQVEHENALRLTELIANLVRSDRAPSRTLAPPDRVQSRTETARAKLRDSMIEFLVDASVPGQIMATTGTAPVQSSRKRLMAVLYWLGIVCDVEARGSSKVRCGSKADVALSAYQALAERLPPSLYGYLRAPNNAHLDSLVSVGDFCQFEDLVQSWVNAVPGERSLLEYPIMFYGPGKAPRTENLVMSFRRICFMRMLKVHKAAQLSIKMISSQFYYPDDAQLPDIQSLVNSLRVHQPPRGLRPALVTQLEFKVNRPSVLEDALDQVWRREKRHLLMPVKVKFCDTGEIAADLGGVAQEFFRLIAVQMQSPALGMFTANGPRSMAWFNPGCCEPTYKFALIGILTALAVHNGFTMPISFPMFLYRKLISSAYAAADLDELDDCWPDLVSGLRDLLLYDGDVEADIGVDYTFPLPRQGGVVSVPMDDKTRDIVAGRGPRDDLSHLASAEAEAVTSENRYSYVEDYVKFLTTVAVNKQLTAFARGFHVVLDQSILATLTPVALRVLVEGHQDISPTELASTAQYTQYSPDDEVIKNFWKYVKSLSPNRLKKLLEFVTASDRIPVNGLRSLGFTIQRNGDDDDHLPSASTCFGILLLPPYSTAETLERKMDQALDNTEGFGLR